MTRLMSCGFETGDTLEWFLVTAGWISTGNPRHGVRCFGDSTIVAATWLFPSTHNELYFRSGIRNNNYASVYFKENTVEHTRVECVQNTVKIYAKGVLVNTYIIPGWVASTWYCVEVYSKIDNNPAVGKIIVRLDNVEILNYTGDTDNAGATGAIDRFQFIVSTGNAGAYYDDIACDDSEWCGDGYNSLLKPDADVVGSIQLDGSDGNQVNNYQQVDEVPASIVDYNESDVAHEYDKYDLTTITLLANEVVKYVTVKAEGRLDTAGEGYIQSILNTNVGDAVALSDVTTHVSYKGYAVDPDDAAAWNQAKINALIAGAEIT